MLIAVVAASLLAMQIYMKRSVSGRLRRAADEIGEQYAPRQTTGAFVTLSQGTTRTESTLVKGKDGYNYMDSVTYTGTKNIPERVSRGGEETVGPYQKSIWDR